MVTAYLLGLPVAYLLTWLFIFDPPRILCVLLWPVYLPVKAVARVFEWLADKLDPQLPAEFK